MLLSAESISKSFGDRELFSELSFNLDKNERMAIIGRNGCGKSTLLKILLDLEEYDGGSIKKEDVKISYLAQQSDEPVDSRSGGERTRDALNKIFDEKPSILILDEPTNHLDMEGIDWLENKLKAFRGAIILVSHDRFLIDKVATKILDLNTTPAKLYKGNYSDYLEQKNIYKLTVLRSNKKLEDKIRHEKAVIDKLKSFNREKSVKRAESREKMLNKLSGPIEFSDDKTLINMELNPAVESGKDVLFLSEVKKSFGDRLLFSNVNMDIKKGEHIGLIGGNGTGKSTIFNIILGNQKEDEGTVKIGTNVSIAYYDQNLAILDENKNIYDEISDEYKFMTETEVRNTLAAFSFFNEDVYKPISALSGGEKGRLSLCKLMLSDSNFLLLDEPTNHLDMESREILEDALNRYRGTVLFISHDRFFLNKCSDRIYDLDDLSVRGYLGNFDDFYEKKAQLIELGVIVKENTKPVKEKKELSEARLSWEEEKKAKQAAEKRARDEAKTLAEIEKTEEEIAAIDEEFLNPENASDHIKLRGLMDKKSELDKTLAALYDKLEELI